MKNSKSFILLAVIVAVLVLGVVYAAISTDLSITTTATVAPDGSNFNVAFKEASTPTGTGTLTSDEGNSLVTTGCSGQTATLAVAQGCLKTVGDYVEVVYTVENKSADLVANLGEIKVEEATNDEYVAFTASYGAEGTSLAAKTGTTTVIVRATLVKAPADAALTATAKVNFTATAAEA